MAAFNDPGTGPVFGEKDLNVTFDNTSIPRYGTSRMGHAYKLPGWYDGKDQVKGFGILAETSMFTWDDFEVFYYDGEFNSTSINSSFVNEMYFNRYEYNI